MAIEDPRVEPFVEWSDELGNPSDNSHHSGEANPDEPDTQPHDASADADSPPAHPSRARAAGAAFTAAMEAVLNFDNNTVPVRQTRTHTMITGRLADARTDTRVNEVTEARFEAAMDTVLTDRRLTYVADTSDEAITQVAGMNVRSNAEVRNNNDSDNNLNTINRVLNEGELPDIDQPISDESYPSNSAFSFNHENENYDKTPEFDPEWDPG
jgi:hypothetical protein